MSLSKFGDAIVCRDVMFGDALFYDTLCCLLIFCRSAQIEHEVLITEDGVEVLTVLED